MKKMLFALIVVISFTTISAQSNSSSIFRHGDRIQIQLADESNYYYVHEIQKGQSLYALSKIFNVSLESIYKFNNLNKGSIISIGQIIKIPLNDNYLFKDASLSGLKNGHYIPVYYKTKPKDNLFRISRVYFNQPTEDLIKRNKLKDNNLSLGQDILIGWLPIDSSDPIQVEEEFEEDFDNDENESVESDTYFLSDEINNETIEEDSITISQTIPLGFNVMLLGSLTYSDAMMEIKKSEVANWDKSMMDNGMVYVLHKNAIIDSYVEMYNPNLKRSVKAKVIGRIPYGAYTRDVCLVLSPRAAKQLGALDRRFKVELKALVFKENLE